MMRQEIAGRWSAERSMAEQSIANTTVYEIGGMSPSDGDRLTLSGDPGRHKTGTRTLAALVFSAVFLISQKKRAVRDQLEPLSKSGK